MIKFSKVRWKNFLSTGNYFLEIDLSSHSTNILVGESGSGKSQMLDAISFGLFGKPFRNINKTQLVNSINQKNTHVEIEFSIGNNIYLIKRGIKPNIFEIYKDSNLLNKDSHVKDYQDYLEKYILKFGFDTFSQVVVLGASNFVSFMQMKPSDRRRIVESLLGIEIFSTMNEILKSIVSESKNKLMKIDYETDLVSEKIDLHKKYLESISKDKETQVLELNNKIKLNSDKIFQNENEILDLTNKINILTFSLGKKDEVNLRVRSLEDAKLKIESGEKKFNKELLFFKNNSKCSICSQDINDDFRGSKISELEEKLKSVSETKQTLTEKFNKVFKIRNKLNGLQASVDLYTKKINSLVLANKSLTLSNSDLQIQITNIDQSNNISNIQSEIDQLNIDLHELGSNKSDLLNERLIQEIAHNLLKDSGIKTKIIRQYINYINHYMNKFLSSMNFLVSFSLDEEFEEKIKARGYDDFSYANFSDGEKQRIDLAILFTWRVIAKMKNSIHTNLLILDEVFDSYLDYASAENVFNVLQSEQFSDMNIFVISHKDSLCDKFANVIKIKKNKNFSEIYT